MEPERAHDLGSSKVANSQKESESGRKIIKGLNGITLHGQRMVRNAAYLMQQAWGGNQLSFLTCTLPGEAWQTVQAASEWSEIVRRFMSYLKVEMKKHGLPPLIVSCTEIQPKRAARDGGCPLHLHMVFRGAFKDYQWCMRPARLQFLWSTVVQTVVPSYKGLQFAASCNVQRVRKSAAGYLGKYMSKGAGDIRASIEANEGCLDHLPSHWYNLTKEARDLVKKNTAYGPEVGQRLDAWARWPDSDLDPPFLYKRSVVLYDEFGQPLTSFLVGTVATHWKGRLGVPMDKYSIRGL